MKVQEGQAFLSLYYKKNIVEFATGTKDASKLVKSWGSKEKILGQIATPESISALMSKWVMSTQPQTVLDPAAGLGGLLNACHQINFNIKLTGVENDSQTMQLAKRTAPYGTKLIFADYLLSDVGIFDGIIANPPYVKAHHLEYSEHDWRYFEERFGTSLDRSTNIYALFLLKIWEDLAPDGRAAIIIPSEFLNANFGIRIKECLLRRIRPAGMAVFPPDLNLFKNALTTSVILFLDKKQSLKAPIRVKRVESIDHAAQFMQILLSETKPAVNGWTDFSGKNPSDKWLNTLLNRKGGNTSCFTKRVGDYFNCRRGIATGANDYFCLNREAMLSHGLDENYVEPCITKASDVGGFVFTHEKFGKLVEAGKRCFLLNPIKNGATLTRYLKVGEDQKIPLRHLPSHRPVWYLPENRDAADIWAAVFSRESAKFILNKSKSKNLTCFHGLYAKMGYENLPPLMVLFLNSRWGRQAFLQVNRFYGNGLNKLEPKDVEEMPCPEMPALTRAQSEKIMRQLLELDGCPPDKKTSKIDTLIHLHFPALIS